MGSALSKALLQRLGSLKANELSLTIKLRMFRRSSAMTTNIFLRNIASLRACGWCSGKIAHHILLDQWHHQTICKIFAIKTILSRDGTYFLFYSASLFQLPSYHVRQLDYIHFIISKITVIYHVKQFISQLYSFPLSSLPLKPVPLTPIHFFIRVVVVQTSLHNALET